MFSAWLHVRRNSKSFLKSPGSELSENMVHVSGLLIFTRLDFREQWTVWFASLNCTFLKDFSSLYVYSQIGVLFASSIASIPCLSTHHTRPDPQIIRFCSVEFSSASFLREIFTLDSFRLSRKTLQSLSNSTIFYLRNWCQQPSRKSWRFIFD